MYQEHDDIEFHDGKVSDKKMMTGLWSFCNPASSWLRINDTLTAHVKTFEKTFETINKILEPTNELKKALENYSNLYKKIETIGESCLPHTYHDHKYLWDLEPDYRQTGATLKDDSVSSSVRPVTRSEYDDVSTGRSIVPAASSATTDSVDMNRMNREFRTLLDRITPRFLVALRKENFEDGMENDSILTVRDFMLKNEYVTYLWLHNLFSQNENDAKIATGILRIISMTVKKEDTDMLLTIVTSALRSNSADEQEAAIMVIEEWRTASCRDKLREAIAENRFESPILKDYASAVYAELEQEIPESKHQEEVCL